ncbi:MAG: TIGR00730 family Rossman fold protein, partial [Candidatus Hydrogenedentes bacterium]|nr:TIGR00730 family Rossman fold protein [Candidatus Hydrogenedentota bacterium]
EGRAYEDCHEFIVTRDMRERKALMEARADAFIALPGGFGTLEELLEVVTLKLLRVHAKPIVIVNTNSFYDPLVALFDHFANQRFASSDHRQFYYLAKNARDAIEHVSRSFAPCERAARRAN